MTRTSKILEDVTNHYNRLKVEHKKIHDELEQCSFYAPDADLKHLKQKKLKIKDEMEDFKRTLKIFSNQ
jgi:hypothetical protein